MYNSLTFYYSHSRLNEDTTTQSFPFPLNVSGQRQVSNEWLKKEHFQHHQWTSTLMRDYETSYCYDVHAFVDPNRPTISVDPFYVDFTPILVMSSKLLYSQVTSWHTHTMFPGLTPDVSEAPSFQPFEWQKCTKLYSGSFAQEPQVLQQLLPRFVAWFKFSKLYFSFYVRTSTLEEDGRISETFSNRLVCHWFRSRCFAAQSQRLHAPFMGPTQVEVQTHLKRVKEYTTRMKTVSQGVLICELNSFIHHWVSAWELNIRWPNLTYCEDRLRRFLQRWAKRRHPNKGWGWVCHKYWRVGVTATKYIFWLGLFSNVWDSAQTRTVMRSALKEQLVKLVKLRLIECVSEVSSFTNWQFFCMDSREGLFSYTVMPLKKWRKSRSFDYFLLY